MGIFWSVDVKFRTDKLKRAYEDDRVRTREWGERVGRLYVQRVDTLYAAENAQTLRSVRALRFHALKGDHKGQYAIDLDAANRLILKFEGKAMTVVRVEEVSHHYDD